MALEVPYGGINDHRRSKDPLEGVFKSVGDSDWEILPKSFDI